MENAICVAVPADFHTEKPVFLMENAIGRTENVNFRTESDVFPSENPIFHHADGLSLRKTPISDLKTANSGPKKPDFHPFLRKRVRASGE
jgi:hypothetical protein